MKYLVETYMPRFGEAERTEAAARARAAAATLEREGVSIRYLRSIYVPEDETCFHLFEAASANAVREVSERAVLRHERIVEALE